MNKRQHFFGALLLGAVVCSVPVALARAASRPPVWVRVRLFEPKKAEYRVHIIAHLPNGKAPELFVGPTVETNAASAKLLAGGAATPWINLSEVIVKGVASVRFVFEPADNLAGKPVTARFDVATADADRAILRTITETDPGNVIALRIPADLDQDQKWLLSIREDTQRRLDELKALKLPDGPLPRHIVWMTGFRSNGQFYTDPAIAQMDFDIIRLLGMNGFWEQNGGQPGQLREYATARGINFSTVYWRNVASPPSDPAAGGVRLDWTKLQAYVDDVYRRDAAGTRKTHPHGLPTVVVDEMDEPGGFQFAGPEYQQEFRTYLQQEGLTPEFFGKKTWDDLQAPVFNWWNFFKIRAGIDLKDESARQTFYWAARFWNHATARLYAMATRRTEEFAPESLGTRVNFGPPWWYDYGTLPRGIDAFEFGRLRGVSLGFNEDWIGAGNPRWPLEINTMLIDWSRAALRPQNPLVGDYITRDADRTSVKLRVFGCLARECKIFDFYYYGPAYTFFDHWSDNFPMVQGVGELARDVGQVDDLLWSGRAPVAQVALLYSKSWPVWKEDDTEQAEQMMVYLALLHAGMPVDIVSDEEVADGRFAAKGYRCLYVVNESVPARAAAAIERWVHQGGKLWATGWAGARDEYNSPAAAWNEMLGIKSRTWKPTGDLARLGQPIKPDDWKRPIFGRFCTIDPSAPPATHLWSKTSDNQTVAAYRRPWGDGEVQVTPWTDGKDYLDSCREVKGSLAKALIYPDGEPREVIARFALDAKVEPPATTSLSQILAWPLWTTSARGVVLLANFTGEPAKELTVRFACPFPILTVRSLRHGKLPFTQPDPGHIECSLPMNDVTDIVVVNE